MTNRPDQEMIDYWSSDDHILTRIADAIRANDEFEAVKLILMRQNQATASTAAIAAWMLGPIKGQAMIADYIEQHGFDLEPNGENQ